MTTSTARPSSAAPLLNGLELVGKQIDQVKIAVSAPAPPPLPAWNVMVGLGVKRENIFMCDFQGRDLRGRPGGLDESKAPIRAKTDARTLADAVNGADVFLGCSAPACSRPRWSRRWRQAHHPGAGQPRARNPPRTGQGRAARLHHCHRAVGLPQPGQQRALCFPYIFRGALDCGATKITEAMKLACVRQIADLAKADISEEVANAYAGKELTFGPDYLIPTPFDRA